MVAAPHAAMISSSGESSAMADTGSQTAAMMASLAWQDAQ